MVLPALIAAGAGIIGGLMSESGKRKEMAQQREFAQHGVRWRVEDARAAGIHPALAMGASVPSYSPVGLGSGIAEGIAGAGQDISRAVEATSTASQRTDAFTQSAQALTLQRMGLENELLGTQIAAAIRSTTNPPFPGSGYNMPGQPASGVLSTPLGDLALGPHTPAQDASDEYGEVVGEASGLLRFVHDLAKAAGVDRQGTTGRRPMSNLGFRTGGGF